MVLVQLRCQGFAAIWVTVRRQKNKPKESARLVDRMTFRRHSGLNTAILTQHSDSSDAPVLFTGND